MKDAPQSGGAVRTQSKASAKEVDNESNRNMKEVLLEKIVYEVWENINERVDEFSENFIVG